MSVPLPGIAPPQPAGDPFDLEELALPRVLLRLHRDAFSGSAILTCDAVTRHVLFLDGLPVYSHSNLPNEGLATSLMNSGRISSADLTRVSDRVASRGCREEVALLELELLDPRALFRALKEQMRSQVMASFAWTRGSLATDPNVAPAPETHVFRSDLYRLLQEGIARYWNRDRALGGLPPKAASGDALVHCHATFERMHSHLTLDPSVEALLETGQQPKRLSEWISRSNTPLAIGALWVLHATGAIRIDGCRDEQPSSFNSKPPDLMSRMDPSPPRIEIEIADEPSSLKFSRADPKAEPQTSDSKAEETNSLLVEIEQRWKRKGQWTHYECLGVSANATAKEIKAVYRRAAKSFHPDALANFCLDAPTQDRANRVFAEITRAHAVLSNSRKRSEYDASLVLTFAEHDIDTEAVAHAESLFRKGQILCQQGNFRGALAFLRPAVETFEPEAAYQSLLGWALYKATPPDPKTALLHLERAAELDASDDVTHFRCGVVLRCLGRTEEANQAFDRAKRQKPNSD
ncbi:DnaJ domain-containing protein [Myxococcota bacterium]|nr:DnaJ domain-containing protein [Myxococcota bacterium]